MRLRTRIGLVTLGLLAGWIGWGWYSSTHTDRVPYEVIDRLDGVELRRYPRTVLVETTAASTGAAFGRLFRYLAGANEARVVGAAGGRSIPMTAPVKTLGGSGERVPMTAPVRTDPGDGPVTMAFFLPESYTLETAPEPSHPDVELVEEPERTVAARQFSWFPTPGRTRRLERALLETLRSSDVEPVGRPVLLQYNDPWTPPFMRRNEVVVEIEPRSDD